MPFENSIPDWLDNPILVKHIRSRLRPHAIAVGAAVVAMIGVIITQQLLFQIGRTLGYFLVLQIILLPVMGGVQVATTMSSARASGILDFHRVSPVSSRALVLGFFLGAPIREYALFALTLPFVLFSVAMGEISTTGFLQLTVFLILAAWLMHSIALLGGLLVPSGGPARSLMAASLVVLLVFGAPTLMLVFRLSWLIQNQVVLGFFGLPLPWLLVVLIVAAPLLWLLFAASKRKLESELLHPLSKPQAILGLALIAAVSEGVVWKGDFGQALTNPVSPDDLLSMNTLLLYLLVIAGLLASAMVTANRADYFKGLWRARKRGLKRLSIWDDLTTNRTFLAVAGLIILATATVADWHRQASSPTPPNRGYALATAIGVMTVGYFGLAFQFFRLHFGSRGVSYFQLFLFIAWISPLLVGFVFYAQSYRNGPIALIASHLSPIVGIYGVTSPPHPLQANSEQNLIELSALSPPLLFLFVFNSLLTMAERTARRQFLANAGLSAPLPVPDLPTTTSKQPAIDAL